MRRLAAWVAVATVPLALGACINLPALPPMPVVAVSASTPTCSGVQAPMRLDRLYFGEPSAADGGARAWSEFADRAIGPRFPDGFTTWSASGQWKPAQGAPVRESSWVLEVVHRPDAATEAAILAIIDQYKTQFHQESVLRVSGDVCASF